MMLPEAEIQPHIQISGRRTGVDRRRQTAHYRGVERRLRERRNSPDQRRHRRYRVKELFFVRLRSERSEDVGQLLDIGWGGLALRSFSDAQPPSRYRDLDVFLSGGGFFLRNVPFRKTSETLRTGRSPLSTVMLRHMGLAFTRLTLEQQQKLDHLLKDYTLAVT
ncbi:MAG: hypothetical protein LJE65_00210 [Desulfobacteraceae bacterium]|nr:hypothetical protein [Desulfobacteraceae bacterium]